MRLVTTFSLATTGIAFALAVAVGPLLIGWLERRSAGKSISDEGPSSHMVKAGTPTMGGLIFLLPIILLTIVTNLVEGDRWSILLPLVGAVALGGLGYLDDLGTLIGRIQTGLTWRLKFAMLAGFSVAVGLVLYFALDVESLNVPWAGQFSLGPAYVVIAAITVFATIISVAISDGLDTLCGGTGAIAMASFGVIAVGQEQDFLVRFAFTCVGALLGFLWFNAHPARIFMGDTGALALGGTLAIVALMTGHWLLLPVIGIVFVLEAASDIIQVGWFKWTRHRTGEGRRVFRMAPLHNHFEEGGWSEPQIVTRFWLIGMAGGILGIALALQVPK